MRALVLLLVAGTASAQQPGWELRVPERLEVSNGSATLSITLSVDRGLTVSRDGGLIVDLAPDAGVTIKKHRLARSDAVDPEADAPRFAIPVKADTDAQINVRVRFWLCATRTCKPIDVRRTVTVVTQP